MLLVAILTLSFLAAGAGRGYLAGVDLGDSTEEVLTKVCPGPDACNYLTGGQDLLEDGSISPSNNWILNLWPPGVVVLPALYILLAKSGLPLPVVAGAIGVVAWTLVLSLWYWYLRPRAGIAIAIAAVLFVGLGQPMRHWYLADGLLYAESLSVALFLGALLALMPRGEGAANLQLKRGLIAGVLLAGAAYLRAPFELAALVLSVAVAAWFAWRLLPLSTKGPSLRARLRRIILVGGALVVCVLVFHALTFPWRIVAAQTVRPGDMLWSQAGDLATTQLWKPSDYLEDQGAGWLVDGTANTPCRVAPGVCHRIFTAELASGEPYSSVSELRSAAVEAWVSHPIEWTEIKFKGAFRFLFRVSDQEGVEFHENGLLLLLLLVVAWLGHKVNGGAQVLMAALFVATLVPSYVFHYEVRYFFPLKSALPLVGALCVHRVLGIERQSTASPEERVGNERNARVHES